MGSDAARFREHETARPTLVVCLLEGVSEDLWACRSCRRSRDSSRRAGDVTGRVLPGASLHPTRKHPSHFAPGCMRWMSSRACRKAKDKLPPNSRVEGEGRGLSSEEGLCDKQANAYFEVCIIVQFPIRHHDERPPALSNSRQPNRAISTFTVSNPELCALVRARMPTARLLGHRRPSLEALHNPSAVCRVWARFQTRRYSIKRVG